MLRKGRGVKLVVVGEDGGLLELIASIAFRWKGTSRQEEYLVLVDENKVLYRPGVYTDGPTGFGCYLEKVEDAASYELISDTTEAWQRLCALEDSRKSK